MVFSSPLFLFLFLPVVLTVYSLLPGLRLRNAFLLAVSLIFYGWGEIGFIFLLLGSTLINYFLGLWVDKEQAPRRRKSVVTLAIILNIGLLAVFKYTGFAMAGVNGVLSIWNVSAIPVGDIRLPIGISFFTFHALSYVVDIYRRKAPAARNPADTALYIFFFPQLIAGPILRWNAIAPQLIERAMSREKFAEGVRRFVGGLSKKVIIANAVAFPADQMFSLHTGELTPALAWFGAICYTLQIYFDFSGYSDMAVGLGKMFGFKFIENFEYPYISQSIRDFWRRWHISLSSWFRDYLYIPLGGNRVSEPRNYFNLVLVFFLCGLWHGASWTFVIWGLYHGLFIVLERTRFGGWMDRIPRPARHLYALLVIIFGWVLFRAETLPQALTFFSHMLGLMPTVAGAQSLGRYLNNEVIFALIAGAIFSMPAWAWLKSACSWILGKTPDSARPAVAGAGMALECALVIGLLLLSSVWLAGTTYNPFIYFRF